MVRVINHIHSETWRVTLCLALHPHSHFALLHSLDAIFLCIGRRLDELGPSPPVRMAVDRPCIKCITRMTCPSADPYLHTCLSLSEKTLASHPFSFEYMITEHVAGLPNSGYGYQCRTFRRFRQSWNFKLECLVRPPTCLKGGVAGVFVQSQRYPSQCGSHPVAIGG